MNAFNFKWHLRWLIPLLLFDILFFTFWWIFFWRVQPREKPVVPAGCSEPVRFHFGFPTERELDRYDLSAFQPTLSGRPESAFFGSVRLGYVGKRLMPSFHEGVDIAPVKRDRSGRPLDPVCAAADGEVVYLNRCEGNSNYGKYAVLSHGDKIYTLYAHLDKIDSRISRGVKVREGETLGRMGFTSSIRLPPSQAHLHFEVCVLLNSNFDGWMKRRRIRNEHGAFNGWNLLGIDPLSVYEKQEEDFDFYDPGSHLRGMPPAFEIILKANRQLDFFRRYPELWVGAPYAGGAMALSCAENGLPLRGRTAPPNEISEMGRKKYLVRKVNAAALERNGCRIVVNDKGKWRLGAEGTKWLDLMTY